MKREILFRAKRVDNGEWVDGYYVITANNHHQILNGKWCNKTGCHFVYNVHPETVCQFTGLLDKNGNKIFEGDIVDAWSQGSHVTDGVIKWGIGTCKFFISNESNSIVWNLSGSGKQYQQETIEITGNIHDK